MADPHDRRLEAGASSDPSDASSVGTSAHAYDYGEIPPRPGPAQDAASAPSGLAPSDLAPSDPAPSDPNRTHPSREAPETGGAAPEAVDPLTEQQAVRGHEPAAQLRSLPGSTVPPPPGRAGYRPPVGAVAAPGGPRPRRGVLAALAVGVLVLALLAGGGALLLWRPWASHPAASSTASAPSGTSGAEVAVGDGVRARVTGLEEGLDAVGSTSRRARPQGEFTEVTVSVRNDADASLSWTQNLVLVLQDGTEIAADEEATRADGGTNLYVKPGEEKELPVVFDVPHGAKPTTARITLGGVSADLPLT